MGPIYSEEFDLPFDGQVYRQNQDFYGLRVPQWTVSPVGLDEVELKTIDQFRWLSVDEVIAVEAGGDAVYPASLAELLTVFFS